MSYCRFSSCDFQCDVYVYADVCGGITTHVAASRYVYARPLPPPVPFAEAAWVDREVEVQRIINDSTMKPIGGPFDGQTFNDDTLEEVLSRLESLQSAGYRVPSIVVDGLREEIAQERREATA